MTQYNITNVAMDISICGLVPNLQISGDNTDSEYVDDKLCDVVLNSDGTYNITDANSMNFYYSAQQFNCTSSNYPLCDVDNKILQNQGLIQNKQEVLAFRHKLLEQNGCYLMNLNICLPSSDDDDIAQITQYQNIINYLEESKVLKFNLVNYDLCYYSIQRKFITKSSSIMQ